MLNNFGRESVATYIQWLSRDPSLPWAILFALLTFWLGIREPRLRPLVLACLIGFAPATLWVWDLPFSGRLICHTFHDERVVLPLLGPLHSKHLYILGLVVSLCLFVLPGWRQPRDMENARPA
jgi:hypothetical protein